MKILIYFLPRNTSYELPGASVVRFNMLFVWFLWPPFLTAHYTGVGWMFTLQERTEAGNVACSQYQEYAPI